MNRVALLLKDEEEAPQLSFKYLLKVDNNWLDLKRLYNDQLRSIEIEEVEKMLNCGSQENGFATYICPCCGRQKIVPFSCKSRICSRCGKRHADEWAEKLNSELFDVTHRHIVLTIADKLWPYFEHNPSLQKLLMDTAARAILRIIKPFNPKKEDITAGLVVVLHPFGSDLKANFHIHILATEGGLTKDNRWINMPYIDYTTIRKIWQYEILKALKRKLPNDPMLISIIDWCYKNKSNGFTIFAKSRIQGKTKAAVRYVGRYVRHPAISNQRIIDYDGEYITFSYKRDGKPYQKILRKFNFIRAVLKHIPEKHFKMVRYYGLYARNLKAKIHKIMQALKRFTMYNGGIYLSRGTNVTMDIANNIVANVTNESSNHITIKQSDIAERSTMHHNLLFQPNDSARIQWGQSWSENLTDFQQRTGKGEGCIEANPQFVDALNNDFHLQSTSPAIDAGTSSAVAQQVFDRFQELYGIDIRKDIEGRTRPQGSAWDIGAYEYALQGALLYGDVTGDGTISATDASRAARYTVGLISLTEIQVLAADVTGKAGVTATDAAWIARKAVGLVDKFPVEE